MAGIPMSFECPVCWESILPPVHQCHHGHLICEQCISHLEKCPVCRDDMPTKRIRNLEIEKIINLGPYSCPYKRKGCQLEERHETIDCDFAEQNFCSRLGFKTCTDVVARAQFVTHLIEKHGVCGANGDLGEVVEFVQSGGSLNEIIRGRLQWSPLYLVEGGSIFFILTKIARGNISWIVTILGGEERASGYSVTLKLRTAGGGSKSTDYYYKWKGRVQSFNRSQDENFLVFTLPVKVLQSLCEGSTELKNGWILQIRLEEYNHEESQMIESGVVPSILNPVVAADFEGPAIDRMDMMENQPATAVVHTRVYCDSCGDRTEIVGGRYKCLECEDYDICSDCVANEAHCHHLFLVARVSDQRERMLGLYGLLHGVINSDIPRAAARHGVHPQIACDGCSTDPLIGPRHKCIYCPDYDLCSRCVSRGIHNHDFFLVALSPAITPQLREAYSVIRRSYPLQG